MLIELLPNGLNRVDWFPTTTQPWISVMYTIRDFIKLRYRSLAWADTRLADIPNAKVRCLLAIIRFLEKRYRLRIYRKVLSGLFLFDQRMVLHLDPIFNRYPFFREGMITSEGVRFMKSQAFSKPNDFPELFAGWDEAKICAAVENMGFLSRYVYNRIPDSRKP